MAQTQGTGRREQYLPCLAGIRGYGFLLVFLGHYLTPDLFPNLSGGRLKVFTAFSSLALFAVPSFFVLSGYLIGDILYHTRNREGYFKVFYTRRILRIFPVFYLTLAGIIVFLLIQGSPIDLYFWSHFLYIHNLFPGYRAHLNPSVGMIHFWSLAVEEQFYLVWPLIVWLFPERRKLISVSIVLISLCCGIRLLAPLFASSPGLIGTFTPCRVDAILLGTLLALIKGSNVFEQFRSLAKWIVACGASTMILLAYWKGVPWSVTYSGYEVLIPLANFTAAGVIIAVMEEGSLLNKICSQKWVCWLGGLSYSLYVFHGTYAPYFKYSLVPQLAPHMRHSVAVLLAAALGLGLTLLLSILSYRLIEGPIIAMKGHIRYGLERRIDEVEADERLAVGVGT